MKSKVYLLRDKKIRRENFIKILTALELLNKIRDAKKIIIKPNLGAGQKMTWDSGVVVGAHLISNLIENIREINPVSKIYVVESDSTGNGFAFEKFENNKYYDLEEMFSDVKLVDITRERYKTITVDGLFFNTFNLPEVLSDYDFFISAAKIKTHNVVQVTGALKNQFGCIPFTEKSVFHPYLNRVIVDVNNILKPDLCIVDGNPAMVGNGPVYGTIKDMNLMIIGNDPVATDTVMCKVMGFDPKGVTYISLARKNNLGIDDIDKIEVLNLSIGDVHTKFEFIPFQQQLFIKSGLQIQKAGQLFNSIGHNIHGMRTYKDFGVFLFGAFLNVGIKIKRSFMK